jgi:hypothetical protein
MQEAQTMEQTNLCEVKRKGGAYMWDKKRMGSCRKGEPNILCAARAV